MYEMTIPGHNPPENIPRPEITPRENPPEVTPAECSSILKANI